MTEQGLRLVIDVLLLLDLSEHLIHGITLVNFTNFNTGSEGLSQQMIVLCVHQVVKHVLLKESLEWLGYYLEQLLTSDLWIFLGCGMVLKALKCLNVLQSEELLACW